MDGERTAHGLLMRCMAEELDAQRVRIGLRMDDRAFDLLEGLPGCVSVRVGGRAALTMSFPGVLERLAAIPNRAGSDALPDALSVGPDDGRMLPYPRNTRVRIQVGDTVRSPRGIPLYLMVLDLMVADGDGGGRPVLSSVFGEGAVATVQDRRGARWSVQVDAILGHAVHEPVARRDLPRLRRLRAQFDRLYANRMRDVRAGAGWDGGLVRLSTLRSASEALAREYVMPPPTVEAGVRALRRLRRRHLGELAAYFEMPMGHTVGERELVGMVRRHEAAVATTIRLDHVRRVPAATVTDQP